MEIGIWYCKTLKTADVRLCCHGNSTFYHIARSKEMSKQFFSEKISFKSKEDGPFFTQMDPGCL